MSQLSLDTTGADATEDVPGQLDLCEAPVFRSAASLHHLPKRRDSVIEIDESLGEAYYCEIEASRKGRKGGPQAPCTVKAGVFLEANQPVLRLVDANGIAPIVALLSHEQADQLGEALKKAARVKA